MVKHNFIRYKVCLSLFLLFSAFSFAQEKKSDTLIIRKDYSLPDPTSYEAYYDVVSGNYYLYPKIGNVVVGNPIVMTMDEYQKYLTNNQLTAYYKEKSEQHDLVTRKDQSDAKKKGLIPTVLVKNKIFESIFGSNKIEIIPQGFASFDLGGLYQKIDNPLILPQNRTSFAFNIQQRMQLSLLGKVGENLQLKANYDTQSGFAFENKMNLVWQAKGTWKDLQSKGLTDPIDRGEDKIIKRVEFGNINMSSSNSLVKGSESLFGLKTEFKLGKTTGTVVLSQQQGESKNVVLENGGMMQTFKVSALDYEANQHYFLGHYFLDNYDGALLNYPTINSKITINKLEVYVLDQSTSNYSTQKSILAIRDLGEGTSGYPANSQNGLYQSIVNLGSGIRDVTTAYNSIKGQSFPNANGNNETYTDGEQFIFNRKARLLSSSEYTYNTQLGYISLNQALNDNQLLAVSYSYTVNGSSQVYKVGEFSGESSVIITKLLKPNSTVKVNSPMWDLMMKNIYSLNTSSLSSENFMLNLYYRSPQNGKVNYLPNTNVQDQILLKLFNWDRLNSNGDLQSENSVLGDGLFDFVSGITVDASNGKVIFTKAKPFGSYLQSVLGSDNSQFVFNELYTQQKTTAAMNNLAQRYTIEGHYKGTQGSSSGISLGAINIPTGSVTVTANGVQLVEGQDYTVDYMLGTVNIINEQIKNSGQTINVSLENQMTFNTQRKRFMGLNLERQFSQNFMMGASFLNYSERPLTQKVNYGQEAVNNSMVGLNMMYNGELPFLTRLANKIPLVKTEAPSNLSFKAEGAYLLPGQNSAINNQSYIDDFEETSTKISLKEPSLWSIASKPEKNQNDPVFAGAGNDDDITSGYGRGLVSWYNIDPRFYGIGGKAPNGITSESLSTHATRRVKASELSDQDYVAGEQTYINTFDITYYPKERGPYNLNPSDESVYQRWGGLMRSVSVSNFINSNVEYVEFWMMDPYADGNNLGVSPKLKLQLGNVSEDILKDGKLQYENGLPTPSSATATTSSNWGVQPSLDPILYSFSTEGDERRAQDVGFDGLNNEQEAQKFGTTFFNPVTGNTDPASDDFVYFLSSQFSGEQAASVQERYKYFRNPDGNSNSGTLEVSSQTPDAEDINKDMNLDLVEDYNQYTVDLSKNSFAVNQNFIVDTRDVSTKFENGQTGKSRWYLFRIPIKQYDTDAGEASDDVLNNVRFARIILEGFENTSTLRFGTLDLVRSDWTKYTKNISATNTVDTSVADTEGTMVTDNNNFFVGSINIEENGRGTPPYVLPPGIDREVLSGTSGATRQNEASLYLKALNLGNEAKGVVKNTALDIRRYKKLKLFVHAEDVRSGSLSNNIDPDAKFFIRLGSDATDNYYEYEASLKYTPSTATATADIWPDDNMVDLDISNFVDAKMQRDQEASSLLNYRYYYPNYGDENKKLYVKGRPSLGNVTTVMIGVRNMSSTSKDLVLWVDEVRLSGIDNEGGYAGNASLTFNLGDFAQVNANAAYSSVGWGSIDQTPSERSQSDNSTINVNTTVNVDKFLPEKSGMKIPVNYSYSQTIEDPKYNPLDTDVELAKSPNKEELKKVVRTYTQQRSIGVVNMRKEKTDTKKKSHFYDVENLSLTAVYNDTYYRDVYTTRNMSQYLKGYIDYNYNFKSFILKPFNRMISDTAKSYKYLRWVKEFNFNPIPTRFSFRTEVDRNYNELQYRNIEALLNGNSGSEFDVIKSRNFYFGWQYNLTFNFTKSLKLDINSATRTLNDNISVNQLDSRSVFNNIFRSGRPVLYNHRVQLSYRLPFEYFPYIDFITAEVGYGFQYNWNARSTVSSTEGNLGGISQNTQTVVGTSTLDFTKFFGKFNYFKKINTIMQKRKQEIDSLNNVYTTAWQKKNSKFKFKSYKFKNKLNPLQSIAYALTSLKQMDISYNENNGTVLPGVLTNPNFFGYGTNGGGPTYGFLFGSQADIRRIAIENGWISGSSYLTDAYVQNTVKSLDANLQIVPVNDFRIDLTWLHRFNRNFSQSGFNVTDGNYLGFRDAFENDLVTYSKSTWIFKTSFKSGEQIFNNLVANAKMISQQLGGGIVQEDGYAEHYALSNAYVLIPAFKAAMEGKSPEMIANPKKSGIPLPNWKITYSGLKNIPFINSQFTKFDLLHGYTSTLTGTGIQSNIDYYNDPDGFDANDNALNPYTFTSIGYVEQYGPLIGTDMTLRNNMQIRVQYNKDRTFLLGLTNSTLTEDESKEYVVGFGYIIKDFKMKLNIKGKARTLKSDLNIRGDFSLRDSKTTIRNILLSESQVTGGQTLLGIKLSADYNMSQNLNIRLFYDQLLTKYKISTAYPLSTIRAGISATFNFGGTSGGSGNTRSGGF